MNESTKHAKIQNFRLSSISQNVKTHIYVKTGCKQLTLIGA